MGVTLTLIVKVYWRVAKIEERQSWILRKIEEIERKIERV